MPVPHKVVPCRYFLQGKCHRGAAACTFKHVRPDGTYVCAPVENGAPPLPGQGAEEAAPAAGAAGASSRFT